MALTMALMLPSGCVTTTSRPVVCPTLTAYSPEFLDAAAAQLEALREKQLAPLITERIVPDYQRLREQVRACLSGG